MVMTLCQSKVWMQPELLTMCFLSRSSLLYWQVQKKRWPRTPLSECAHAVCLKVTGVCLKFSSFWGVAEGMA